METEALELELAFEEKDSSFSSALFNLIFWVWFNDSSISLISLFVLSLFLCKTLNPSPRVFFWERIFRGPCQGLYIFGLLVMLSTLFGPNIKTCDPIANPVYCKVITIFQQILKLKIKKQDLYFGVEMCFGGDNLSRWYLNNFKEEIFGSLQYLNLAQILKDTKISIFFRSMTRISQTHYIKIQATIHIYFWSHNLFNKSNNLFK